MGFFDDEDNLIQYDINKQYIIDWIYRMQVIPEKPYPDIEAKEKSSGTIRVGGGFIGGSFLGDQKDLSDNPYYNQGHIAMAYTAISTLITLGDSLERLDKEGIIEGVKVLQREDGR